jgi:glycosyltransferase involved in cell wall biosynthesis
MHTLIAFATKWGSKLGGINSFNSDLLTAFGFAYHLNAQIICVVASDTPEEKEAARDDAGKAHVQLLSFPYAPLSKTFDSSHGQTAVELLKQFNICFDPDKTVWLGHDRITGGAAIAAAMIAGGRSAVIHHMSYDDYETYAEDSQSAHKKKEEQVSLLKNAGIVLAVGPLLRDAAQDRVGGSKPVHMLIPGLAEIDPQEGPHTFMAFLGGRLSVDAAPIKQGNLGIAAFAKAYREAREDGMPDALLRQPKLLLRGVDFENQLNDPSSLDRQDPERQLKEFAFQYADAVINLHTLPFTHDRNQLYSELGGASVALMPSWHEGFGLVGWEAIAAGVPLILTKNSGVYRLLEEQYFGAGTGAVYPLDVRGAVSAPYIHEEDLNDTVAALQAVANNPRKARQQASILRNMVGGYTWAACAEKAVEAFEWDLEKGSIPAITSESLTTTNRAVAPAPQPIEDEVGPLRIPSAQWRAGIGMADSQLLRAEEALLEFDAARQPDVDKLNEWLDDLTWPLSLRLITGAGGAGKTRLALELCQTRKGIGWNAGFLDSNLEAPGMMAAWRIIHERRQPTFVVVDYAETRQTVLLAFLRAALQTPTDQPMRILLLARDGGEWWDNLPSKDSQCEALLSGYATTGPFRLSPLYAAEKDRRHAYLKALTAFAESLGVTAPIVDPDLGGDHFERPLYVQMAALLSLYGERPTTAQGLTRALLNHERRYWLGLLAHFNWPEPERQAEQLLALSTLSGGFATPRAAQPYWEHAKASVISTGEFNSLFREVATLYPGAQGLQALRPDLLGEALVAQALLRPLGDTLLDAVLDSSAGQLVRLNALTVVARISTQRADLDETLVAALARQYGNCGVDVVAVSTETASRLPKLAEAAFERLSSGMKSQVAVPLSKLLKEESVQLDGLGCLVFGYLARKARDQFEKKPGNLKRAVEYAKALDAFGLHLRFSGDYKQACDVGASALQIFRRLIASDRQLGETRYAAAMGNYASSLREAGETEKARDHIWQVVQIYKRLAQTKPDWFEEAYAHSLRDYASVLRDLSQSEDAIEPALEGVEIYRRLVGKDPDQFEARYASSLIVYSNSLREIGQIGEAFEHTREALELFQRLSQKRPDRFEPSYATSLSNYAASLRDVGQDEESLQASLESLEIGRRLAQKNPERFESAYATYLNNHSVQLSDWGETAEALDLAREALAILKRLAQKNPDRFEAYYATSLRKYGDRLGDAGQSETAVEHAREALEISSRLAQERPDRFEPEYAASLSSYASHLSDLGRNEEALQHARAALEIRKLRGQKNPKGFASELFSNLCFVRVLAWLALRNAIIEQEFLQQILSIVPVHRKNLMLVFSAFTEACSAIDHDARKDAFRVVLAKWIGLSQSDKYSARPYWLCAATWCAKFDCDSEGTDAKTQWRKFVNQRNGHVPEWMLEVERRLEFKWPDNTEEEE